MFWFILGLLVGSVAGFFVCALFTMSRDNEIPEVFKIEVVGPDPYNNESQSSQA